MTATTCQSTSTSCPTNRTTTTTTTRTASGSMATCVANCSNHVERPRQPLTTNAADDESRPLLLKVIPLLGSGFGRLSRRSIPYWYSDISSLLPTLVSIGCPLPVKPRRPCLSLTDPIHWSVSTHYPSAHFFHSSVLCHRNRRLYTTRTQGLRPRPTLILVDKPGGTEL
ncbi:hypothetical protein SCLCIDRAFT_249599 [Scleroderma citrinum Foug A]|uniref:Uncharacterized protein n=1 Tax=Scleroderma citrinum Foug A TaxID=1036808 RepID=A0A0C3DIV1_9AGAM|nr:hypothetical protein SCLCIDRAFT_249599 [Scleroderma citrinum Foug A]